MKNLIYVFISNNFNKNNSEKKAYSYEHLPEYYLKTIEYNLQHFDGAYLILQNEEIELIKNRVPAKVKLISIEDEIEHLEEYKVATQIIESLWPRYKTEVFLYHAFLRLIMLCAYVYRANLTDTVHIEADNIIYNGIDFSHIISPGGYGFGAVGQTIAAPGVLYFNDGKSAYNLLFKIVKLLYKGEDAIKSSTGLYFEYITDMNFLDLIRLYKKDHSILPSLPVGEFSENLDKFKCLFDPASYGQYLGGTNNGHPEKHIELRHYIGPFLSNNIIQVGFDKKPFVLYDGKHIPLFNLHMHNKAAIDRFLV